MNTQVLLLTSAFDFSADLVALQLEDMGVPFLRINREDLLSYRMTIDPLKPSLIIYRDGELVDRLICFKSIWFRHPVFPRNTPQTPLSAEDQLQRSQWAAFTRAFVVFDNVFWMNWPPATYLAESKPYQLLAASRCGFSVPRTLVGNDAEQFRSGFSAAAVLKSVDTVLVREGKDSLFTYTTRCDAQKVTDEAVGTAPLIMQEYLDGKIDCRVTVVGDKVFAVKILKNGRAIAGDWRMTPKEELEYVDLMLPKEIEGSCRRLVKKLGLVFGGIDLLMAKRRFVFLEINPTGEWGWLSSKERPIDREIARWLAAPH